MGQAQDDQVGAAVPAIGRLVSLPGSRSRPLGSRSSPLDEFREPEGPVGVDGIVRQDALGNRPYLLDGFQGLEFDGRRGLSADMGRGNDVGQAGQTG